MVIKTVKTYESIQFDGENFHEVVRFVLNKSTPNMVRITMEPAKKRMNVFFSSGVVTLLKDEYLCWDEKIKDFLKLSNDEPIEIVKVPPKPKP